MLGLEKCALMKKKQALLFELEEFARSAISGISCRHLPPDRLVRQCARDDGLFLGRCLRRLDGGENFHLAWARAAEECRAFRMLDAGERELVTTLGRELGRSDEQSQLSMLNAYLSRFREAGEEAKREYAEKKGVYTKVYALAGAFAALLIL